MTILETLIAATLALVVLMAVYDFMVAGNRSYARETDLAEAQNQGRVVLDLIASDLRQAGFSPLGMQFYAVDEGSDVRVRLQADIDGDGAIGTAGVEDELVSYVFSGPNGEGTYQLQRGVDLDQNWDFSGADEEVAVVADNLLPIDYDGDGIDEPFLAYTMPPPATPVPYNRNRPGTRRVTLTFGVRSKRRDHMAKEYPVVSFQTDVFLRNLN